MKIQPTKLKKLSLLGALIGFGGVSVYISSDKILKSYINSVRPGLEKTLSNQFGHPLSLGPYKGLRPWGVAIGPSRFSKGPLDNSSFSVSSLKIQIAPIASFFNWRPVLVLSPTKSQLILNSNENGTYWVFGKSKGGEAPRLDLKIKLDKGSTIFVDSQTEEIQTKSTILIKLPDQKISGALTLLFPDKGSFALNGSGYFDRFNFNGKLSVKNLGLENLHVIGAKNLKIIDGGKINGRMKVSIKPSNISCKGDLSLSNLTLKPISSNKLKLYSKNTSIKCSNGFLEIPQSRFEYGSWNADLSLSMPLKKLSTYELDLHSSIHSNDQINSPLNLKASLPLAVNEKGFSVGELNGKVDLNDFSLSSLNSLIGIPLSGSLSTNGSISGSIASLRSDLKIELDNPQISAVRLQEKWKGNFMGSLTGGGELSMASVVPDASGKVDAKFAKDWSLRTLTLERYGGFIYLDRIPNGYSWNADEFRLDRLEVAVPPEKRFKRVMGKVIGEGSLRLDPFFVDGQLTTKSYRWLGIALKKWQLKGSYSENMYSVAAEIIPHSKGKILINAKGRLGGRVVAKAEAKGLSPRWLVDTGLKISEFNLFPKLAFGQASDLNRFLITPKTSLENQIITLEKSLRSLNDIYLQERNKKFIDPAMLKGSIDAIANLEGSKISDLKLDLEASGKVWVKGDNRNKSDITPFMATFRSLSLTENGEFSILNLPFSMLSLFFSTPSSLSGMFGMTGRYNFKRTSPELNAELVLKDAKIVDKEFVLEKGNIFIANSTLTTDIFLRESTSSESITISGDIPLAKEIPFDLKIESNGDALSFLDGLTNDLISWRSGNIDLKILVRGTLNQTVSNGFVVIRDGNFVLNNMLIRNLTSKIFFDFNRFEVQNFEARIGRKGTFKAQGAMSLFREVIDSKEQLSIVMKEIELNQQNIVAKLSSDLQIKGSLFKPLIGGEITIEQGAISTKRSRSKRKNLINVDDNFSSRPSRVAYSNFPEQNWDYQRVDAEPIILFLQDQESSASKIFNSSIPKGLSYIGFNSLNLYLGPELRVESLPFASFTASGKLILDGLLNENLDLTGLIRLEKGRVNLFTTTFDLDRKYKNTATFIPSMGLVPFLDIKLITRVPDVVQDPNQLESSNDFVMNSSSSVGIGGSRFVKIELIATGLADRISETYELTSTPALPKSQLFDLIGGNSLTMLMSGGQGEVLMGLLNRSFLSPALSKLSDAFSEKLHLSFYPAFVSNKLTNDDDDESNNSNLTTDEGDSEDLSPQQAWIAEVGMDLSDKINFSIQTTPNRNDIPPHGTVTYQLHPSVGVLGSFDQDGNWQSQLQLFFRY